MNINFSVEMSRLSNLFPFRWLIVTFFISPELNLYTHVVKCTVWVYEQLGAICFNTNRLQSPFYVLFQCWTVILLPRYWVGAQVVFVHLVNYLLREPQRKAQTQMEIAIEHRPTKKKKTGSGSAKYMLSNATNFIVLGNRRRLPCQFTVLFIGLVANCVRWIGRYFIHARIRHKRLCFCTRRMHAQAHVCPFHETNEKQRICFGFAWIHSYFTIW